MENENNKNRRGNWFRILVIVLMLLILCLLVFLYFNGRNDKDSLEEAVKAQLGQLDGKSEEEIQEELNRVIEEGMFHMAINPDPVFYDGKAEGNLEIENVPANHYGATVTITLNEDGETVYESGLIQPNYHIQTDSLSKNLEKGDYAATAEFHVYDLETKEERGVVSCEVTLHIQN